MRDLNREPGTGLGVKLSSCICNSSSVHRSYLRVLGGNSSGIGGHTCFLNLILCFQFFVLLTDTPDSMLLRHRQLPHRPSDLPDASAASRTSAYRYLLSADKPPLISNTSPLPLPRLSRKMPGKIHLLAMVTGQFGFVHMIKIHAFQVP